VNEREITIQATEHDSAHEAIQHLDVSGDDRAVLLGGKYLTMPQTEAEKLGEFGDLGGSNGKTLRLLAVGRADFLRHNRDE
jgi:hypothetical protein